MTPGEISETLKNSAVELYDKRERDFTPEAMRILERLVMPASWTISGLST